MATLTIPVDPEVLETARLEAERRHTSMEKMLAEYIASVASAKPGEDHGNAELVRIMHLAPLGDIGALPTREEIYAERTWPRS
jgi:hypothetical protein